MSEPGNERTVGDVHATASSKGLWARFPARNELFVDIDSPEQLTRHKSLLSIFERKQACSAVYTPSPSGLPGRQHCVVTLLDRAVRDEEERLTLQAMLGSDPTRELLGWIRLRAGVEPAAITVFFEKPEWMPPAPPPEQETEAEDIAF